MSRDFRDVTRLYRHVQLVIEEDGKKHFSVTHSSENP